MLKGSANVDNAVAIAKEAELDVRIADLLRDQDKAEFALSDEQLEQASGVNCSYTKQ